MEDEIKTLKQNLEDEQVNYYLIKKYVKRISNDNVKSQYAEGMINIKELEILRE